MLEVTGTINGKRFNEDIVSARELMEMFNLEYPEGDMVEFNLHDSQRTYDRLSGHERFAGRRNKLAFIQVTKGGDSFTIRYYDSKVYNEGTKSYKYSPRRIPLHGSQFLFSKDQDLEKVVMLHLNPACADSPIRRPGQRIEYYLHDRMGDIKQQLEFEKAYQELRNRILNDPADRKMVHLAKGIKIGAHTIPSHLCKTPMEARMELIRLAESYPYQVAEALDSNTAMVRGVITDCIDQGAIVLDAPRGGAKFWRWNGVAENSEILRLQDKQNPKEALFSFFNRPGVFSDNYPIIEMVLLSEPTEVEIPIHDNKVSGIDIKDLSPQQEYILKALSDGLIAYDSEKEGLYEVDQESGEVIGKRLVILKNKETWKQDMLNKGGKRLYGLVKKIVEANG